MTELSQDTLHVEQVWTTILSTIFLGPRPSIMGGRSTVGTRGKGTGRGLGARMETEMSKKRRAGVETTENNGAMVNRTNSNRIILGQNNSEE